MSNIIPPNNYIQYDNFITFKVLKANDTVCTGLQSPNVNSTATGVMGLESSVTGTVVSNVDNSQQIQINDYGRTVNAINYAAIKYLTEKYDFIRTTFIDFRGRWAIQLTDDLPVFSIYMDLVCYRLNNYSDWPCDPMPFILAIEEFMANFNQLHMMKANSDIVLNAFTINFKVHVIAGKTYYYIDNLFMTDNNAKYKYNKNKKTMDKCDACCVEDLTKERDIMYDNVYTILTQIPGVLEKYKSVNKELIARTLYNNIRLEQYLIDANTMSGYKLF